MRRWVSDGGKEWKGVCQRILSGGWCEGGGSEVSDLDDHARCVHIYPSLLALQSPP